MPLRTTLAVFMQMPVLSSTVLLTMLLSVGLFFFIRASTKDRIEVARLVTNQPETSLLEQIQNYFTGRAYRIAAVDAENNLVTFEGMVRPSVFLAMFLTLLAAVGILCLVLVLAVLLPQWAAFFYLLLLLAPLAGVFYWKKSMRPEQVSLRVESLSEDAASPRRVLTITGHRDELAELQRSLQLQPLESD